MKWFISIRAHLDGQLEHHEDMLINLHPVLWLAEQRRAGEGKNEFHLLFAMPVPHEIATMDVVQEHIEND